MSRPHVVVGVDDQLQWVVALPEVCTGTARASSAAQLTSLNAQFEELALSLRERDRIAALIDCALRAALEIAGEPPELPFIGEPFGGDGGSD